MHSLRFLDITLCLPDWVPTSHESKPRDLDFSHKDFSRGVPPLEGLRIGLHMSGTFDREAYNDREKSLLQLSALIRAASPTLFEFAMIANKNPDSFFSLKTLRFPRLRRLSLSNIGITPSDIASFVLVHQPQLTDLKVHYYFSHSLSFPTLSDALDLMQGVDHKVVDPPMHQGDNGGDYGWCRSFAYAKRAGEIVELSLSVILNMRVQNLSNLFDRFGHLEILTLVARDHREQSFKELMVRYLAVIQTL